MFAFGYLGAKHRDSGVILASIISQGICLLWFVYVTYLLADATGNQADLYLQMYQVRPCALS